MKKGLGPRGSRDEEFLVPSLIWTLMNRNKNYKKLLLCFIMYLVEFIVAHSSYIVHEGIIVCEREKCQIIRRSW